jgi:hypothetical protein
MSKESSITSSVTSESTVIIPSCNNVKDGASFAISFYLGSMHFQSPKHVIRKCAFKESNLLKVNYLVFSKDKGLEHSVQQVIVLYTLFNYW